MEFIQSTINWCKGEIFEGQMFALFGILVLIIAGLYWRYGHTPFSKAMVIPFLVVGLLCIVGGISLVYNNYQRIDNFQEQFNIDRDNFIKSEALRVEGFMKWYPYTLFTMAGLILLGLILFLFLSSAHWKAIGLGFVLLSFSIIYLDHFSEERAKIYYNEIMITQEAKK
jgi:hypothetical protein